MKGGGDEKKKEQQTVSQSGEEAGDMHEHKDRFCLICNFHRRTTFAFSHTCHMKTPHRLMGVM